MFTPHQSKKASIRHSTRSQSSRNMVVKVPLQHTVVGVHCSRTNYISSRLAVRASPSDEEEPDWNKEMSIFQKRISRPNQLATLRELEGRTSVGKVLFCKDNLAIISGLESDAPIGTKLSFISGGTGVLLWHRSNNMAFAILLGGASRITAGEGVECKIKGVLQIVDEAKGPVTQKDFQIVQSPAGDELFGKVFNFLGVEQDIGLNSMTLGKAPGAVPMGLDKVKPLLNQQVDMQSREQISECLLTGVKAIDILTPLGRGMSFLVVGPNGSGKTSVAIDTLLGQMSSGVRCVYSSVGHTKEQLSDIVKSLKEGGAFPNTAIVSAAEDAALGVQLATICAACSIGERIRDDGGHALVVLDTVKPLVDAWDAFIIGLSDLGQEKALEGLIKDPEGRDMLVPENDNELVDYQGMLVSGAIAQRRGFFSTLFLRPAKLSRSIGGGSMTLMHMVPGKCATGISKRVDISKYQTLSADQKEKIEAILESKWKQELASISAAPGEMTTEVVEEFISIVDGQMVLGDRLAAGEKYVANPKLSLTRVGTRAYSKVMESLAPQVRLDLAQAEDARKFSLDGEDPTIKKYDAYAMRIQSALLQERLQPASLQDQVVTLLAVQKGFTDGIYPDQVPYFLKGAIQYVWTGSLAAMEEIGSTRILTAKAEKSILLNLEGYLEIWSNKK